MELGDNAKSFVERLYPDGTTNRFQLSYNPLDGASVEVSVDGIDVTGDATVEEATGVLVLDVAPDAGSVLISNGTHYRYFKDSEIQSFVEAALSQHSAKRVDSLGRTITIGNLPSLEEYPVAIYATTLALYTLATDASFDIDISAPDGVMIPRGQRYRQLMDMIQTRKEQYRELCTQLGIGMYSIDVFSLRRISKTTNRYVPVYKPQEVDDKSVSQRVELSNPTYGDANVAWPTENGQLTCFQDIAFEAAVTFTGDYAVGYSFIAKLVTQRGSVQVVRNFDLTVDEVDGTYTANLVLDRDSTLRLPSRCWWQVMSVDDVTEEETEIIAGDFFCRKSYTAIL
jgi:hypothetical protein